MTWEHNNIMSLENCKLQSGLYSVNTWGNNFFKGAQKTRGEGINDFFGVLFCICQIVYNKHCITFLIIKPTNMLFKN